MSLRLTPFVQCTSPAAAGGTARSTTQGHHAERPFVPRSVFGALLGAVLWCGLAGPANAQTPTLVWEAKGLSRPESVLHDPVTDVLFVTNINGPVMQKDGNGFISRIKPDGTVLEKNWAKGMNSPTGMGLHGRTLYVADVDTLLALSAASGSIEKKYKADGAIFLNDVVVADNGTVYVSDTPMNTIWRLKDGVFEPWLTDDVLNGPNGLLVSDGKLLVASFGRPKSVGQEKEIAGLYAIDTEDKSIAALGKPIGNLDGLGEMKPGTYLATDWADGALYKVDVKGKSAKADQLLDLNQGSADLLYLADKQLLLIPMMLDNTLAAYKLGGAKSE
jgi:DNA-binding beta-propeller fold protein YncE